MYSYCHYPCPHFVISFRFFVWFTFIDSRKSETVIHCFFLLYPLEIINVNCKRERLAGSSGGAREVESVWPLLWPYCLWLLCDREATWQPTPSRVTYGELSQQQNGIETRIVRLKGAMTILQGCTRHSIFFPAPPKKETQCLRMVIKLTAVCSRN